MYMICPPRNLVSEANPLALVRVMLFVELKKRYKSTFTKEDTIFGCFDQCQYLIFMRANADARLLAIEKVCIRIWLHVPLVEHT